MRKLILIVVLVLGGCSKPASTGVPAGSSGNAGHGAATLVLKNVQIATVDPDKPAAQAMAIVEDRIVTVGSESDVEPWIGASTKVIDLGGQFAMPGFIESHGHLMNLGDMKTNLDLLDTRSWEEIVAIVAEAAKRTRPGDWIVGRGWHQEKWDHKPEPNVEGFPYHDALSKISPNNPVMLIHSSNHASMVNAKAMELAEITSQTKDPEGGQILRDATGRPIGVLRETASALVSKVLAEWKLKQITQGNSAGGGAGGGRQLIRLAIKEAEENGVTSFQDAGEDFRNIDIIKQAFADGDLHVRVWVMVKDTNENLRAKLGAYKAVGLGDQRLTIGAIKKVMDGALGSRGAWFLEPYADLPGHTGLTVTPVAEIQEAAQIALENHVQLCVHAIGDRANRETLDIYEAAFKSRPELTDLRWRIEHAQHLDPADIPRFGTLGVIAAMQGIHATSDAPFVVARIGAQRAEAGAYAWQKLMQSGALICNGTDTPNERINPIANFYASVTRKTKDGTAFYPEERMTREQALASYTINGAFAAREEGIKGSLKAGKLADITVLSRNIMTVPEEEIPETKVMMTIAGGKVIYQAR